MSNRTRTHKGLIKEDDYEEENTYLTADSDNDDKEKSIVFKDDTARMNVTSKVSEMIPTAQQYIEDSISKKRKLDKSTSIYYSPPTKSFRIRSSPINFDKDNVIINGKTYLASEGLFELLFLAEPVNYSTVDVLRRNFDSNGGKRGFKTKKYITYINIT